MELSYQLAKPRYALIEESKIETNDGAVYLAQDLWLKRKVCVKLINIPGDSPAVRKINLQKAIKEVIIHSEISLNSQHVPAIFDEIHTKDKLYIVMQWVEGETLTKKMRNLKAPEMLYLMEELCGVLQLLEKRNLNHRDIKPDNIKIVTTAAGKMELILLDFGISLGLVSLGVGTKGYQAPELLWKGNMKHDKLDIFAVGVMLYEFFAKKLPEPGIDYKPPADRQKAWAAFTEPCILNDKIPPAVNQLIVRCMSYQPADRPKAKELEQMLRHIRKGRPYNYGI